MTKQIQTVDKIKKNYFDQWDATEHPSTCDSWQYGVEHCNCFIEAKWKWVEETIAQAQQETVERERERIKNYIELKKKYWSNDGLERSDLWFSRLAGYEDVLEALKGQK